MKPKNKFQKQVFALSQKLTPITKVQENWAFRNCIKHYGKRMANGVIICLDCGHKWKGNSELGDMLLRAECPQCSAQLETVNTRKTVYRQVEYFCIVTTKGGFQVLRFFLINYYAKAGQKAQYSISEVVQRWIAPDGKYETIARTRPMSYCFDNWNFSSKLEIRPEREHHHIIPTFVYPHEKIIHVLKRNGYMGDNCFISHFTLFRILLSESRAETLIKASQRNVLGYFAGRNFQQIDDYWASIKICIRNNYLIKDAQIWRDYIDLLRFFHKDLHNAKYVCPADLTSEHDRYVKKKKEWQERVRSEQARKKALIDDAQFKKLKAKFFGIYFTDGIIHIRMLDSVEEIKKEGDLMHHCVFTNDYHLNPDTIILSAYMDDRRLETVEYSLTGQKVIQCRGVCNKNTEYHDKIIQLVEKNKRLIKKRLVA